MPTRKRNLNPRRAASGGDSTSRGRSPTRSTLTESEQYAMAEAGGRARGLSNERSGPVTRSRSPTRIVNDKEINAVAAFEAFLKSNGHATMVTGKKVSGKKIFFIVAAIVTVIVGIVFGMVFFPEWKEAAMGFFLNGGDDTTEL
ncbi:MAG: hypothetical protein SGILL_001315 [Bacillariaceae sp.]